MLMDRRIAANDKNAAKIVKASLTEPDGGLVTLRCFTVPMVDDAPGLFSLLTGPSHLLHSLHMNGLNHICGIRPEIIS
jgi:hypothetical protein